MRQLSSFLATAALVAGVFLLPACSTTSSAAATDGAVVDTGQDTSPFNACVAYGSVCKGNGVCGAGYFIDTIHLCSSSVEVCCGSTTPPVDASADAVSDATIATDAARDAPVAHDAPTTHDAGHDATVPHDAGHDAIAPHDSGHDAGHDAGEDSGKTPKDSGVDAEHSDSGDAKAG